MNDDFNKLLEAARRGQDSDWELVDAHISKVRSLETISWAIHSGLLDHDPNVRDFAASLLEDWNGELPEETETLIGDLLKTDPHLPVRLRLASGRWKKGDHSDLVRSVLEQAAATDDPVMSSLAQNLLER